MKRKESEQVEAEDLSAEVSRLQKELKDAKLALYNLCYNNRFATY